MILILFKSPIEKRCLKKYKACWEKRLHFLAAAATAMRHILIDYSRQKIAEKRGGTQKHLSLDELEDAQMPCIEFDANQAESLLSLDTALQRFIHEARSASALDHPNIGTIFTIEELDNHQVSVTLGYTTFLDFRGLHAKGLGP